MAIGERLRPGVSVRHPSRMSTALATRSTKKQSRFAVFLATRGKAAPRTMAAPAPPEKPSTAMKPASHGNLAPRYAAPPDGLGAIVGSEAPTMGLLFAGATVDRSETGQMVEEATGFKPSDLAFGLAVGARLTGLDSGAPMLRRGVTRYVRGKLNVYADRAPSVLFGALASWKDRHDKTAVKPEEKVETKGSEEKAPEKAAKPEVTADP